MTPKQPPAVHLLLSVPARTAVADRRYTRASGARTHCGAERAAGAHVSFLGTLVEADVTCGRCKRSMAMLASYNRILTHPNV